MEPIDKKTDPFPQLGDRLSSDVVVRIRTEDGRDDWIYCHSHTLTENSKYFADRLSKNWPTCKILDSRYCVEIYCQESMYNHHINLLRLLYVPLDALESHGVKNVLGILSVAFELECPNIVAACVDYIEAVPWEENEEEEIIRIVPKMGMEADRILARLKPVNPSLVTTIFVSAVRFAASSPPLTMTDLKSCVQEQLDYMITEDDDSPLLTPDTEIKSEVNDCVKGLSVRFNNLLEDMESVSNNPQIMQSYLSDFSWVCQLLTKLEIMKDFVTIWVDASDKIVKLVEQVKSETSELKYKVIEVTSKVLEAIGYGSVIIPTAKRVYMVKVWLPFVRVVKPLIDSTEDVTSYNVDGEIWQALESTFVAIVLALPSGEQGEILTDWLTNGRIQYPDLTEAFEVWCYRSKVVKRRLDSLQNKV